MGELENKLGKLIVLDGTDGSGKATQSKLLIKKLELEGYTAKYFDFPRHDHPHASLVDDYLTGKFGKLADTSAYAASVLFAVDRFGCAPEIREVINCGGIAICDRYVSANMGHQAGKIQDPIERDKFLEWLDAFEFGLMKIPRPDLNIFLYVPTHVSQKLVSKKEQRNYLVGKTDIHETDKTHQMQAAEAFFYVAEKYGWPVIRCAPNNEILPLEKIHDLVWSYVEEKL